MNLKRIFKGIALIVTPIISFILIVYYSVDNTCSLNFGGYNNNDFYCRFIDTFEFILLVFQICFLVFYAALSAVKSNKSRLMLYAFIVVVIIQILIASLYVVLPDSFKLHYLEGFTVESCEKGESSVPWGLPSGGWGSNRHFTSDYCFEKLGLCNRVEDEDSQIRCYDNNR
jgi:hypothetical protein